MPTNQNSVLSKPNTQQTPGKQSTSDTCTKTANKCQRVTPFPRNGTVLTNLVGESGQTKVTRTKGTKKVPWHWDAVHQEAFDAVKTTIAKDVVLAYPDYDKVFEVYTNAHDTQLGLVITQSNRPLAFFSKKLSEAQQKYSVTKKELLAKVEKLKEFKGMLWGQKLIVYTDHQNLMCDALGLTSDQPLTTAHLNWWNLFLSTKFNFFKVIRIKTRIILLLWTILNC